MNTNDLEMKSILETFKRITVVGLSPDEAKPSHRIPVFMRRQGYQVSGVYPREYEIAGIKIYPALAEVPIADREFVNVFRRSDKIPTIVDEVLEVGGVKVLWLQLGITNASAENRAEAAGLKVVSDRCLLIEYKRLLGSARAIQ